MSTFAQKSREWAIGARLWTRLIPVISIAAVLDAWGLATTTDLERSPDGTMSEVFFVRAKQGRFVLRGHRAQTADRVAFEHKTMSVARTAGIPTPVVVPTLEGDDFTWQANRWWSLLEWIPSRHVQRGAHTTSQARVMGRTLADIHLALGSLNPHDHRSAPSTTGEEALRTIDQVIRAIPRDRRPPEDKWSLVWLEGQKRWLSTRPDEAPPAHLVAQVIHGDYHDANVLFEGEGLVGVLDWEKAEGGDPAAEVVRAVHLSFDLALGQTDAFLSGYRSRRALTDAELDAGALRYGYGRDRCVWLFKELYLQGNERMRSLVNPRPFQPFSAFWSRFRLRG